MDLDALEQLLKLLESTNTDCAFVTARHYAVPNEALKDRADALYYATGSAGDETERMITYLKEQRDK